MKGATIYAKNSGMEIKTATAVKPAENGATKKEGRIQLRLFTFGNGDTKSVRFISIPQEAFAISCKTLEIVKVGGKATFTHKFNKDGVDTVAALTIEKWVNGDKSGYAYGISKGDVKINVPVSLSDLLYTGELLRSLAIDQSWSSFKNADGTEAAEETVLTEEAGHAATGEVAGAEIGDPVEVGAPEPVEKGGASEPTDRDGNVTSITGKIESVRKDGKGFKLNGTWYAVNDETEGKEAVIYKNTVTVTFQPSDRNPVALKVAA